MVCLDFRRVAPVTVISGPSSQSCFREFIEARVLRLLMDTCYHHAEACVHRVAALPSVRAGSQGRDLESP